MVANWPITRWGNVGACERYEKESLLPALARKGGTAHLTQNHDGTFILKFISQGGLPTSALTVRGSWFRVNATTASAAAESGGAKASGESTDSQLIPSFQDGPDTVDLLIGGFEHIHPHILLACAYSKGNEKEIETAASRDATLYMRLATWGLDDFLKNHLASLTQEMTEMTKRTETYFAAVSQGKSEQEADALGEAAGKKARGDAMDWYEGCKRGGRIGFRLRDYNASDDKKAGKLGYSYIGVTVEDDRFNGFQNHNTGYVHVHP